MTKRLNGSLALRRDNDYNYSKYASSFVPEKGEVCLVDTTDQGLCAKVGDGVSSYGDLEFTNLIFERVNFQEKNAYVLGKLVTPNLNKIYIDIENPNNLYYYNGFGYTLIGSHVSTATPDTAGIVKLYKTKGQNEDGTMTQKAITDNLNKKVEASVDAEEELVIFN